VLQASFNSCTQGPIMRPSSFRTTRPLPFPISDILNILANCSIPFSSRFESYLAERISPVLKLHDHILSIFGFVPFQFFALVSRLGLRGAIVSTFPPSSQFLAKLLAGTM